MSPSGTRAEPHVHRRRGRYPDRLASERAGMNLAQPGVAAGCIDNGRIARSAAVSPARSWEMSSGVLRNDRVRPQGFSGSRQGRARPAHQAVAQHLGRRSRERTAPAGQIHRQPGRRRAGLRHAAAHPPGRRRGDREGRDPLHADGRHSGAAPGHRGEARARERTGLRAERDHRHQRREERDLQRAVDHAGARRRGDHSRALLGLLSRHGAGQRRRADDRGLSRSRGLQADTGPIGKRHHAAHTLAVVVGPVLR